MGYEYNIEYADVIKAYQSKLNDLMSQLITSESKLNAAANVIEKINQYNEELQKENEKLKKSNSKKTKDDVVDFN